MAEHKTSATGYGPHAWDCEPCVAEYEARKASRQNPHRPGTKVAAEWDRMNASGLVACDPRTETYWSM